MIKYLQVYGAPEKLCVNKKLNREIHVLEKETAHKFFLEIVEIIKKILL